MAHEEYSWSQTSYKFLSDSQLVALDEYFEIQDIDDPLSYLEYQDCKTWGELVRPLVSAGKIFRQ